MLIGFWYIELISPFQLEASSTFLSPICSLNWTRRQKITRLRPKLRPKLRPHPDPSAPWKYFSFIFLEYSLGFSLWLLLEFTKKIWRESSSSRQNDDDDDDDDDSESYDSDDDAWHWELLVILMILKLIEKKVNNNDHSNIMTINICIFARSCSLYITCSITWIVMYICLCESLSTFLILFYSVTLLLFRLLDHLERLSWHFPLTWTFS